MKNIKTYKLFTESLKDKLKGKSDDDIRKSLSSLDMDTRLSKINSMGLDSSFLPPKEKIENYLNSLSTEEVLNKNKVYELPSEYLPSKEEIEKFLPNDIDSRLSKIKLYKLGKEFLPPRSEIMKYLKSRRSISSWIYKVSGYGLDSSYLPSEEYIKEYMDEKYEDEDLKERAESLLQHLDDEDTTIYDLEPDGNYYDMKEFTRLNGEKYESYAVGTDEEADKSAYDRENSLIDVIGYGEFNSSFVYNYVDGESFADDYFADEEDYIRDNFRDYGIDTEDELNYDSKKKVDELEDEIERLENERDILDSSDESAEELEQEIEELEKEIEELEQEIEDIKDDEDNYDVDDDSLEEYINSVKKEIEDDPVDYLKNLGYDPDSISSALKNYIDKDEFIDGIISAKGRGQALSSYDGVEYEEQYNDTWYYIYRIN